MGIPGLSCVGKLPAETATSGENQAASATSHPLRTALDGDDAGARDLDQTNRQHQRDEALDLLRRAGDLEHEALQTGVDDAGTERIREPQCLDAIVALAAHLDHGELALDRGRAERHV